MNVKFDIHKDYVTFFSVPFFFFLMLTVFVDESLYHGHTY
jgi:hypothetical protein